MRAAREEAELVLFNSVEAILQKNRLKPSQVGYPDRDACFPCRAAAAKQAGLMHVRERVGLLTPPSQLCKGCAEARSFLGCVTGKFPDN